MPALDPIIANADVLLAGLALTIALTLVAFVIGGVVGLGLALAKLSSIWLIRAPAAGLISFLISTPVLVQVFWVYYALPILTGVRFSAFEVLVVAIGLNHSAVMAETYRAGILSIAPGQRDAAFVLGLSRVQTMRFVVLPQAIRILLPPLASNTINLVKDSSLAGFIGANDLLNAGRFVVTRGFFPVETYTFIAIAYFLLTYPIAVAGARLERRLRRSLA